MGPRRFAKTPAMVAGIALIFMVGFYAVSFYEALRCPASLTFEAHILWYANQVAHGGNIYDLRTLTGMPAAVCIYTPL